MRLGTVMVDPCTPGVARPGRIEDNCRTTSRVGASDTLGLTWIYPRMGPVILNRAAARFMRDFPFAKA